MIQRFADREVRHGVAVEIPHGGHTRPEAGTGGSAKIEAHDLLKAFDHAITLEKDYVHVVWLLIVAHGTGSHVTDIVAVDIAQPGNAKEGRKGGNKMKE